MGSRGRASVGGLRFALAGLLAAVMVVSLPLPATGKNHALFIGVSKYLFPEKGRGLLDLDYADDDARELARLLVKEFPGAEVLVDVQATRQAVVAKLVDLRSKVKDGDKVLIFLSGHGVRDPDIKQTYWLTYDTNLGLLEDKAIRLEDLLKYVNEIEKGSKLLLLDHCFSGDVAPADPAPVGALNTGSKTTDGGIMRANRRGLRPEDLEVTLQVPARGMIALAASRDIAWEAGSIEHGIFTQALINALTNLSGEADQNDDDVLQMTELMPFLRDQVALISGDLNQEVSELVNAADLSNWDFAKLDPNVDQTADVARAETERAETERALGFATLDSWKTQHWISIKVWKKTKRALEANVEKLVEGGKPCQGYQTILLEFRDVRDSVGPEVTEEDAAEALELMVANVAITGCE